MFCDDHEHRNSALHLPSPSAVYRDHETAKVYPIATFCHEHMEVAKGLPENYLSGAAIPAQKIDCPAKSSSDGIASHFNLRTRQYRLTKNPSDSYFRPLWKKQGVQDPRKKDPRSSNRRLRYFQNRCLGRQKSNVPTMPICRIQDPEKIGPRMLLNRV